MREDPKKDNDNLSVFFDEGYHFFDSLLYTDKCRASNDGKADTELFNFSDSGSNP